MKTAILITAVLLGVLTSSDLIAREQERLRYDFNNSLQLKKQWLKKGKQFGTPMTRFVIVRCKDAADRRVLAVEAKRSSGILMTKVETDTWRRYPVLRWRWRILRKIAFTGEEPDDQAAVIYFGDGSPLRQYQVGYRWEHNSPVGSRSFLRYGMGATTVSRICVRNKEAKNGEWYIEERNFIEDFKRAYGRLPRGDCALTIGANSQHSRSDTLVEIDFIEFRKAKSPANGSDVSKYGNNKKGKGK